MNSTKQYENYLNFIEHDKSMNRKQIMVKHYTNVSALILVLVEVKNIHITQQTLKYVLK